MEKHQLNMNKMKIHKLPSVGLTTGILIVISFTIRYFFIWYDPSQLIIGLIVGCLICVLAYIYDWMLKQNEKTDNINKRLDSFTKWFTKKELE